MHPASHARLRPVLFLLPGTRFFPHLTDELSVFLKTKKNRGRVMWFLPCLPLETHMYFYYGVIISRNYTWLWIYRLRNSSNIKGPDRFTILQVFKACHREATITCGWGLVESRFCSMSPNWEWLEAPNFMISTMRVNDTWVWSFVDTLVNGPI